MEPLIFEFSLADFDVNLLPIDPELLISNKEIFLEAVTDYITNNFKSIGGKISISVDDDNISIQWIPESYDDLDNLIEWVVEILKGGTYDYAEPFLKALLDEYSEYPPILYNYGMLLSDQGHFPKAIRLLKKLTEIEDGHANGWNALGIALLRSGHKRAAVDAMKKSLDIEPENAYALRNLTGLIANDNPEMALPYIEKAAQLLPNDQQTQYGYGLCLTKTGNINMADKVLKRAIDITPYSETAELCRTERSKIAIKNLKEATSSDIRMDVVMYCVGALQTFNRLGAQKTQAITTEIALLGRGGLNINEPDKKYTLKSLKGEFSALQLLSYMYVGLKKINPAMDAGIDFSKEYESALGLFNLEK